MTIILLRVTYLSMVILTYLLTYLVSYLLTHFLVFCTSDTLARASAHLKGEVEGAREGEGVCREGAGEGNVQVRTSSP